MARVASRVRSLTLIEPTLFHLLAPAGKVKEHDEIRAVAERVIEFVDAGDSEERRPAASSSIGLVRVPTTRWSPAFVSW